MTLSAAETILWVDDDLFFMQALVDRVTDEGYPVITADGPDQALELLEARNESIRLAILDMAMPHGQAFSALESKGGYATGLALARRIRNDYPDIQILAFSVATEPETIDWFRKHTLGYLIKPARLEEILRTVNAAMGPRGLANKRKLRAFIVHGHDEVALLSLKNYLQNTLGLPEPVVLREQASAGRTIMEKFEDLATTADIAFVLLTPDDTVLNGEDLSMKTSRARQNVIFELGYFLGKLDRGSGKVLLLHKGQSELPSDIYGVVYVDISNGVEAAGEQIRRELSMWLT
jgi:predicted nucleotide-binding protein